jgi:PilZ domain-containing protein
VRLQAAVLYAGLALATGRVSESMPRKGDIRRHKRVLQSARVRISWMDRFGSEKFAAADIVDISETGMRIKVSESLTAGTLVTLQSDRPSLHGRASVRSCVRHGAKFLVGMEFIGGLKWKSSSE